MQLQPVALEEAVAGWSMASGVMAKSGARRWRSPSTRTRSRYVDGGRGRGGAGPSTSRTRRCCRPMRRTPCGGEGAELLR